MSARTSKRLMEIVKPSKKATPENYHSRVLLRRIYIPEGYFSYRIASGSEILTVGYEAEVANSEGDYRT